MPKEKKSDRKIIKELGVNTRFKEIKNEPEEEQEDSEEEFSDDFIESASSGFSSAPVSLPSEQQERGETLEQTVASTSTPSKPEDEKQVSYTRNAYGETGYDEAAKYNIEQQRAENADVTRKEDRMGIGSSEASDEVMRNLQASRGQMSQAAQGWDDSGREPQGYGGSEKPVVEEARKLPFRQGRRKTI